MCSDRNAQYGDAEDNFATIAELWTSYAGHKFSAIDVAAMCVLMKVSRLRTSPAKEDHWVDIAGYAACGGGIAAEVRENQAVDNIHVR